MILGADYGHLFLKNNWYVALLFVLAMVVLNIYFLLNWKMFQYLEKEDWSGLFDYLSAKLQKRGQLSIRQIRMYLNTALVLSKVDEIVELRDKLKANAPRKFNKFVLELGIPYLVDGQSLEGYNYFNNFSSTSNQRDWIHWAKAFCLLNLQRREDGKEVLVQLLGQTKNPIIILMSTYLLTSLGMDDDDTAKILSTYKDMLNEKFSKAQLNKKMNVQKETNLLLLLFGKVYTEALDWCFDHSLPSSEKIVSQ